MLLGARVWARRALVRFDRSRRDLRRSQSGKTGIGPLLNCLFTSPYRRKILLSIFDDDPLTSRSGVTYVLHGRTISDFP